MYVGSQDYRIYCFNASNGAEKWSVVAGNIVDSSPAVVNGILYVGSNDHHVYAYALISENPPSQSTNTNTSGWTTAAFDAIAFAVAAMIFYTILRFANTNRMAKLNSKAINSPMQETWISEHTDAVCILVILTFSVIFFINLGNGPLGLQTNKRIHSGHTTWLRAEIT